MTPTTWLDRILRRPPPPPPGSSPDRAVVVTSPQERAAWLRQHGWNYSRFVQRAIEYKGRQIDVVELSDADNACRRTVYFDVTSFAGSPQTDLPTRNAGIFPLSAAADRIGKYRPELTRTERTIHWEELGGTVTLKVVPMLGRGPDGRRIRERVTLTYVAPWLERLSRDQAKALNVSPMLSTFIAAQEGRPGRLLCKVDIFDRDHDIASDIYMPLICGEARRIVAHAVRMTRLVAGDLPEDLPRRGASDPIPFEESDFAALEALALRDGPSVVREGRDVWIELPWDPGAVSSLFSRKDVRTRLIAAGKATTELLDRLAGRTSLVRLSAVDAHPMFGSGIIAWIRLPIVPTPGNDAEIVDELNRWELHSETPIPQFGTWSQFSTFLAFQTFLPARDCADMPGILQELYAWSRLRHERVREWAGSFRNSNPAAPRVQSGPLEES